MPCVSRGSGGESKVQRGSTVGLGLHLEFFSPRISHYHADMGGRGGGTLGGGRKEIPNPAK